MLVEFYSNIQDISQKESVKILVDYMSRHEEILKKQLNKITDEQQRQITEQFLKYEPEYASCRCFENLNIDKDSSVDDVIDAGLQLNQCLVNLYNQTEEVSPNQELKDLFSSLKTMEIAEKKKLSRMRGM